MPDSPPLLSIIIPNYNYEKYIGATIESALALDWARKEIVVVDDGSTDRSLDVIKSRHGSHEAFLVDVCGLDGPRRQRLRRLMTEPADGSGERE